MSARKLRRMRMKAKSFWWLMFIYYWVAEALCIMMGLRLLGTVWFFGLCLPAVLLGNMIERWPTTRPEENDKHWVTEDSVRGIVYILPPVLAVMSLYVPWYMAESTIIFLILIWRLVYLRRCLRPD